MATLQEIKNELLNGPLASEIMPYLSKVFNDEEPLRSKIPDRQGILIPDAAFEIMQILSDPTKRLKIVAEVTREDFTKAVYPLLIKASTLAANKKDYWVFLLKMLTENEINITKEQVQEVIDSAKTDKILSVKQEEILLALFNNTTQSRLNELGWILSSADIQQSMKEEQPVKEEI